MIKNFSVPQYQNMVQADGFDGLTTSVFLRACPVLKFEGFIVRGSLAVFIRLRQGYGGQVGAAKNIAYGAAQSPQIRRNYDQDAYRPP